MKKPIILSVANEKGGVGKTTTALNLAAGLATAGKWPLLIDLDSQQNLSDYLGCDLSGRNRTISDLIYSAVAGQDVDLESCIQHNPEGLDYIPASKMLATAPSILSNDRDSGTVLQRILRQKETSRYDYIILDCRPALDLLVTNALAASDAVLIPVQAEKFAVDGLEGLLGTVSRIQKSLNPELHLLGVLITMADRRTNMAREVEKALRDTLKEKVFSAVIPRMIEAPVSTNNQRSLVNDPSSKLGVCYKSLAEEVIARGGTQS